MEISPQSPSVSNGISSPAMRSSRSLSVTVQQNHEQVRSNTIREMRGSRFLRALFWFSIISNLLQFVIIAIVSSLTLNQSCKGAIRIFLIIYEIILIPRTIATLYQHRYPLQTDVFGQEIPPNDSTGRIIYNIKEFSDFIHFGIVIAASLFMLNDSCSKTSPALYWTMAGILLYNILIALIPILLMLMLLLCLPCVIILLRWLYPVPNRGAPEETIKNLPEFKYSTTREDRTYGSITIEEPDAICTICLQEYLEGNTLRILNCNHHFHQTCADEWFRLQATCPLCVRPICQVSSGPGGSSGSSGSSGPGLPPPSSPPQP